MDFEIWEMHFDRNGTYLRSTLLPESTRLEREVSISSEEGGYVGRTYAIGLYSALEKLFPAVKEIISEKKSKRNKTYVSSYCHCAHRMCDGKPIEHKCRIIPPRALLAERSGDFDEAQRIMSLTPVRTMRRGVKAA